MKGRLKECYVRVDVSGHQPTKDGTPYTFQHIAWSDLVDKIRHEVKEMDPAKMAAVKAAVLDCYTTNSKAEDGGKRLPQLGPGEKWISDDLPVRQADIYRAQEELDSAERFTKAARMSADVRAHYMRPARVKGVIKALLGGTSRRTSSTRSWPRRNGYP